MKIRTSGEILQEIIECRLLLESLEKELQMAQSLNSTNSWSSSGT